MLFCDHKSYQGAKTGPLTKKKDPHLIHEKSRIPQGTRRCRWEEEDLYVLLKEPEEGTAASVNPSRLLNPVGWFPTLFGDSPPPVYPHCCISLISSTFVEAAGYLR